MHRSRPKNVSGAPKYLSFNAGKDDGATKIGFESLTSAGQLISITTTEAFNSNRKPYSSTILQTDMGSNKHGGNLYNVTTYTPKKFDVHSVVHPHHDARNLPISNITSQNISVTMSTSPAHQSFLASPAGQNNVILSALNTQTLRRGVPVMASPVSIAPTGTAVVGTTDLRNGSKPYGGPAQLTIFYAGSVCVYDDVSPEKAQAIMFLAGNGNSPSTPIIKAADPTSTRAEAPAQRPCGGDGFIVNKLSVPNTSPPCPRPLPSPISVVTSSRPCGGRGQGRSQNFVRATTPSCPTLLSPISITSPAASGGPTATTDITTVRSMTTLTSPSTKPNPSKIVTSLGPPGFATPTTPTPSAVPQARKASLARFLEKRKERATSAAPYPSKQSPD